FVADSQEPPRRLRAHMAKANPHWRGIGQGAHALALFQGPHAYASPSWHFSSPRVPTRNYISVHVHSEVRIVAEGEDVLSTLALNVAQQEGGRARPWRMADLPESYLAGMVKGVIAVELAIDRLEGKFKLSQNMPEPDRAGAIAGLLAEGDAMSKATAEAMARACGLDDGSSTLQPV